MLDTQYVGIATPVPGLTLNTEFSQAPETTGNVGVQHTARLRSGGTFITRVDYSHADQFWRSQIPNFRTATASSMRASRMRRWRRTGSCRCLGRI